MFKARLVALGALTWLALTLTWLAPAAARAAGTTILILGGGLGAEEARLVEALRIYTGDVEGRLVLAGQAPATLDPRAVERLAGTARTEGADVVAWGARRADGRAVFYVLDVGARDLRETEVEPLGAERAAVEVALKVRALLFRRRADAATAAAAPAEPPGRKPPPVVVPVVAPVLAPLAPRLPAPINDGPPLAVARPAPAPVVWHRLALGAAYELVLPSDTALLRHAVLFSIESRLGAVPTSPFALFVDGALATSSATTVRGFALKLTDVPFGAGVVFVRDVGSFAFAFGPRASVHLFDITAADDDGRRGAARRLALGLGGVARIELSLSAYMKVYVGGTIEALVPKQEFTIGGEPALGTGGRLIGVLGGFRWLIL